MMFSDASFFLTELFILATNRCNLSCRHCYVSSGPSGHLGLTRDQVLGAAQDFNALYGRQRVTLSGGEFFMRKDLVDGLGDLAALHDLFILTNGMLLSTPLANRIKDLPIALRFGLDGATASTHDWMRGAGAFDRLQRGLEVLLSAGISPDRLEFFFTATPENFSDLPEVLRKADRYGIRRLVIEPVAVHGRAAENWSKTQAGGLDQFRQAFELIVRKATPAPKSESWRSRRIKVKFTTPTIYYDGRVFPFTPSDDLDEQWGLLGNINDARLRELLDAPSYRQKAIAKAMRHLRSAGPTAGPYRFWRGVSDATCFA
ncbi:radical SAM protein [Burkholderia cepacia]|uniref:radical SAM protein n=1 Tax=Burkholderia cepacia TaxID=292 RepID=UPI002018A0A5|nr:radical SAM protein [Burkholderia cepacia]UQO39934.1 radical SAM protein [Burkholderia cepacia]UQO49217.1 radical SAM protein [Burkholderia cepacia]UQP08907.1 radical SAM protein [Burkholderia cepacia]